MGGDAILLFVLVLVGLVLYFLPSFVAHARDHHNRVAITLTNLFFGWSVLGWIISLIWSVTAVRK